MPQPLKAFTTILVVEDNPLVLKLVCLTLERSGFTVLSAASPEEARQIEADPARTIHLLLSDVIMLHTYGSDLAMDFQTRRPEMRVLLMSGDPDQTSALTYGYHFLRKPFLPGDLLGKVSEVLRVRDPGAVATSGPIP